MTAELTFTPGRVPGIAGPARRATRPRPGLPDAAAPRSKPSTPRGTRAAAPDDLAPGMTLAQRRALAALIHVPAGHADARESASEGSAGLAWIAVLACAFAWTLAIFFAELAPQASAGAPAVAPTHTAMPHVVEARSAG